MNLDAKLVIREVSSIVDCDEGIPVQVTFLLYFDELESANPIGSRETIHKIGCFYWCLKSLPPWLNCDMRYTFIVALVSYLDVKSYSFFPVIDAITNDLVKLQKWNINHHKKGKVFKNKSKKRIFLQIT